MKLIYLFAFLLIAGTASYAQQKKDTAHHASSAPKKAKMKDELGLNKKQQTDVKASKKEYKDQKAKVNSDPKLSDTQKKAKIKALKKEKKAKVNATLTPEQQAKAKTLKKEKKAEKKAEKAKQ